MTSLSNGRFWLIMAAVLVVAALFIGGAGGDGPAYDPRSVNPDGAKGLVETLERLGATVDLDDAVPSAEASTAIVLRDRLSFDDSAELGEWVERGGVLVVADLSNDLAAGISGLGSEQVERGTCTIAALDDVQQLPVGGSSLRAQGNESCFGDGNRALIVAERVGQGTVVTVGSPDLFTNANLDEADAAVLAVGLLAPRGDDAHVSFVGPSVVEFGEEDINDLVPTRVRNAIWQLMAAFLFYGLYRARRLGGVVAEPLPVHIEGSELVLQAGVLSERAKDPASAAQLLRADMLQRVRKTLSIPSTDGDDVVASRIADRTGLASDQVAAALLASITTESELVELAQQLSEIDTQLLHPSAASGQREKASS